MSRWFASPTRKNGWLVVDLAKNSASYAHGRAEKPGEKPLVSFFGSRSVEAASDLERLAKEHRFSRYNGIALLQPGDYQLIQLEAPDVPLPERKAALRWKLKDSLDYPLDETTFEVLDIPSDAERGRPRTVYAVAARSELIRTCISRFESAKIPLSVVDIPETAQRNIGALREDPERGLALLYPGDDTCLVTVNFRQELLLARRIEIGRAQFVSQSGRDEAFERVGLEVQRTLDLVDRQFPFVAVNKLLIAPQPEESGLSEYLRQNLGIPVEPLDLADSFRFEGQVPDSAAQWRMFHLLGASLRQ